jgi:hypothetical protein
MTSEALQLGEPVIRYLTEIVYRRLGNRLKEHIFVTTQKKSFKTFGKR